MGADRSRVEQRIAFIGFGEAGQALTEGWRREADVAIAAYDIKTDQAATRDGKLADYARHNVIAALSPAEAVATADVIVSAVTADATLAAADEVVPALRPGQLYLDINSAAPSRKRAAAERIAGCGGLYVDVAVMAPVHPRLHKTPLLIGGPGAAAATGLFERLAMDFELVSDEVGEASTIKMVRSVMIKGMESLVIECIGAAVAAGIDERILASLEGSFPGMNWRQRAGYMMERVVRHGQRRAAEMREVAVTMDDLGVGGIMSAATAERQQGVVDLGIAERFAGDIPQDYTILARAIIDGLAAGGGKGPAKG